MKVCLEAERLSIRVPQIRGGPWQPVLSTLCSIAMQTGSQRG